MAALRELRVPLSHYLSPEARAAALRMMRERPKLAMSSIEALRAARDASRGIPIVMVGVGPGRDQTLVISSLI